MRLRCLTISFSYYEGLPGILFSLKINIHTYICIFIYHCRPLNDTFLKCSIVLINDTVNYNLGIQLRDVQLYVANLYERLIINLHSAIFRCIYSRRSTIPVLCVPRTWTIFFNSNTRRELYGMHAVTVKNPYFIIYYFQKQ